jgi:hypothetical protein
MKSYEIYACLRKISGVDCFLDISGDRGGDLHEVDKKTSTLPLHKTTHSIRNAA